jgi:FSR family fosmidomycin resistance protein-like MFS transporter
MSAKVLGMVSEIHRKSLAAITLSHVTVDMQTGALPILLPVLLSGFGLSYAGAAAIMTANQVVIAIAQPLFGLLGDRRSYKWLVWAGCLLTGVAMASVLWLPSYALVVLAVILSGLGSAAFHPEALSRVRAVSGSRAASATSVFFSGGNIGFAAGPILATVLLERLGKPGIFLMLLPTALGLALLASQWRVIARDLPRKVRAAGHQAPIALGLLAFLMSLITLRMIVTGGLQTFIPLYYGPQLGHEPAALMVTVLLISGAVGTLSGGLIAERIGRRPTMIVTIVLALLCLWGFSYSDGWLRLVFLGLTGASLSSIWPLIVVMMQEALPGNVGLASGLSLGTSYGATGLGVAALGVFADHFGLAPTMTLITLLPLAILALSLFLPEKVARAAVASD